MSNSVALLAPQIRSRRALLLDGWSARGLARAQAEQRIKSVRNGWYIDVPTWKGLHGEDRHLVRVIAVARDAAGGAVMSHISAAVLWGLPLYRSSDDRVHMTLGEGGRISSSTDVLRHTASVASADVVVIDGIRCTSLSRTVFDLMRSCSFELAVSAADAAERMMALRGREWDLNAVESWRRGMRDRLDQATGARGIRQARWVAAFADGRAQLPGESVSRLQLHRLGFAAPRLQVPVAAPDGGHYFVDFGMEDVRFFGEFDGESKYRDEAMRRGMSLEDVLLEEKHREDWIRGRTQWGMARWGSSHIRTARTLGTRLASFGVRAP
ncbi:hypothetical protein [Microbacterium sp. GXF0217]